LVGLEQGLPHSRTLNDPAAVEEERRLCYVGITRAQERLYLTHARERRLWGSREPAICSQFLTEIPELLTSKSLHRVSSNQATGLQSGVEAVDAADRVSISSRKIGQWVIALSTKPSASVKIHPRFGSGTKSPSDCSQPRSKNYYPKIAATRG